MVNQHWIRLVGIVGLVFIASGCVRTVTVQNADGSTVEMPKDEYRAGQEEKHAQAVADKLQGMMQDCPPEMTEKEASECRWSNAMTMVMMPQIAANLTPDGYWQYKAQNRQFWLGVAQLAVNNPLTNALAQNLLYGSGGPGASRTEINLGNRTAKGGGSGEKGISTVSASGDSDFSDLYISTGNKSPLNIGDGSYLTGKDSQYQTGDGVQGQAFTRPNNQPLADTEGGSLNNNSQGLGFSPEIP